MKRSNVMLEEIKDKVHSRHMAMTSVLLMRPESLDIEKYGPHLSYVCGQHRVWGFTFKEGQERFIKDYSATEIGK